MNILNEKTDGMDLGIQSVYYLITPDYKVKATKKDVEEALPDDKADAFKSFLKEHKIKWKKPQDMLKVVDFLAR